MSCNYADGLSPYENKGKLGLPEIFDSAEDIEKKCVKLADLLRNSEHTVVHTGAGISTSCGIPDFRGPNGVWTLEERGEKPKICISWNDAKPTKTHMALLALQKAGYVSYIVTQNIDGLHLRSGIPRKYISELHGNMFTSKCDSCQRQFVMSEAVKTVGLKSIGMNCPGLKKKGRRCRGKLFDTILDWEDSLPEDDLDLAHMHSCVATLSICLGTTLQIVPSGNLPVHTKKRGGSLVICNLQPTKQDRHADVMIHTYVDDVIKRVLEILEVPLPDYDSTIDPVVITSLRIADGIKNSEGEEEFTPIDWTINAEWVQDKELFKKFKMKKVLKKKKLPYTVNDTSPKKFKHENSDGEKFSPGVTLDTSSGNKNEVEWPFVVCEFKNESKT
ncbi:NAD-dependent protein deacetylase Sirt6 [Armadillidium nasatum]|uniref:protein acetyllysine N-acetyltransferase n=1 Tax=Armadillidium nasatum TaxID=96803 RepID=A0A5N5TB76_9CRUS|nr:NAD-dependent protein deacetylase Sirt6 [Armadillidium nasatum]